jgi:hypothetical protein
VLQSESPDAAAAPSSAAPAGDHSERGVGAGPADAAPAARAGEPLAQPAPAAAPNSRPGGNSPGAVETYGVSEGNTTAVLTDLVPSSRDQADNGSPGGADKPLASDAAPAAKRTKESVSHAAHPVAASSKPVHSGIIIITTTPAGDEELVEDRLIGPIEPVAELMKVREASDSIALIRSPAREEAGQPEGIDTDLSGGPANLDRVIEALSGNDWRQAGGVDTGGNRTPVLAGTGAAPAPTAPLGADSAATVLALRPGAFLEDGGPRRAPGLTGWPVTGRFTFARREGEMNGTDSALVEQTEGLAGEEVPWNGDRTGRLASFAPERPAALDAALRRFLGQVEDLGQDLGLALASPATSSWLVALAVVGVTAEILRRQRRRLYPPLGLADGDRTLSWLSPLPGPFSTEEL